MKKIFSFLVVVNLAFGFNFNSDEANNTIDSLAYKGKILTQMFDMFLQDNKPKMQALEQNLTVAFSDMNESLSKFSNELLFIQNTIMNSFMDANFSLDSFNNQSLLSAFFNDDNATLSTKTPKNSEIRDIVNLDRSLIDSVSILNVDGELEVEIWGERAIEGKEFRKLASKSADIVRKYNSSSKKVRVYYFHENSKFSGRF
ncbi:MAG: hypothetical protein GX282_06805 [Campylobacteraceae bacterium]|nr:hypothetical protein [Campylobacteraceae bacterium]